MTYETVGNVYFPRVSCFSFEHCSVATVKDIVFYETSLVYDCSQMMETSRDVWKSSPNVIAHIEMEAKKLELDDELRRKKVQQLKFGLFLMYLISVFSLKLKLVLIRVLQISFRREFSTKWNSKTFSMG